MLLREEGVEKVSNAQVGEEWVVEGLGEGIKEGKVEEV